MNNTCQHPIGDTINDLLATSRNRGTDTIHREWWPQSIFLNPSPFLLNPRSVYTSIFWAKARKLRYTPIWGSEKMDCGHHYRCIVPVPLQNPSWGDAGIVYLFQHQDTSVCCVRMHLPSTPSTSAPSRSSSPSKVRLLMMSSEPMPLKGETRGSEYDFGRAVSGEF